MTGRVACAQPCRACPWRKDSHADDISGFSLELAERLAATSRDTRGFGPSFDAPLFACHDSREGADLACAGWLAVEGHAHPVVRLMIFQGRLSADALEPRAGWPALHASFVEMLAELREQVGVET